MNQDEESSEVKGVIEATTGLVKAVPIYDDLVQPAAKELGATLEIVAKTVNLALAPVSGVIWSYETIKDFVSTKVSEKLKNVDPIDITPPNPVVVGPALEALKYTGSEETLRNMYANLLANALDQNTKEKTHPSFVEMIKQLSPNEAEILKRLSEFSEYPHVCSYFNRETIQGGWASFDGDGITQNQVNSAFASICKEIGVSSKTNTNSALDNFRRLQLLDINITTNYKIKDSFLGQDSDELSERLELDVDHSEKLHFTEYGVEFIETCVRDKT